ncbi:hypothetical protein BGE01nite_13520 [Brevifollis gellanilyticus]|uniref:Calx-beta domain-containing protein n=2 Tax=Brevifollis gellanilyticus TaxID=748831 RepID=A0A512M6U9_9BACT|nr:hypothetical protein BGE01nite_13520 [Brevifollis gellanilyticus]
MNVVRVLLMTCLVLVFPAAVHAAASVHYAAVDLPDTTPGEDLWRLNYRVAGHSFVDGQGFNIQFDSELFKALQNPSGAAATDWDALLIQPDSGLGSPGFYDLQALKDNPALGSLFVVEVVWLGPGKPGPQTFTIYNTNLATLETGLTAPVIGTIPDTTVAQNQPTGDIPFTVGVVGALTAASSNTTLVPNASIVLGGSGTNRTVAITPVAGQFGTSTITVTDPTSGATSSFVLTVQGFGKLGFATPGFMVSEGGDAAVVVSRSDGSVGEVKVSVSTSAAGATATAGGDYTVVASQELTFPAGSTTQTILIPTAPDAAVENNETFTVTLSNPTGGAVLGSPTSAKVSIVDPSALTFAGDDAPPSVTLTAPAAKATLGLPVGGKVALTGMATDKKGVRKVQYSLNGGAFLDATLDTPGAPSTGYQAQLTPASGSNTVVVRSVDFATANGNATVTNSSTGSPKVTLQTVPVGLGPNSDFMGRKVVSISGKTVTLDGSASATVSQATPFPFATTERVSSAVSSTFKVLRPLAVQIVGAGSVTAGFAPSSNREAGERLVITAAPVSAPAPGSLFVNWTIVSSHTPADLAVSASDLQKPMLSFVFRENLVLRANFTPNILAPLGDPAKGSKGAEYNGLIHASSTLPAPGGTAPSNSTEGLISALVTTTGSFSAKLTIDGSVLNVPGVFDEAGHARFGRSRATTFAIARTNKPSFIISLDIDISVGRTKDAITGTVVATDFQRSMVLAVSTLRADRAHYDGITGATTVPGAYLGAGGATQTYSLVLPPLPLAQTAIVSVFGVNELEADHGGVIVDQGSVLEVGGQVSFNAPAPDGIVPGEVYTLADDDDTSPTDDYFSLKNADGSYVNIDDTYEGELFNVSVDPHNHQVQGSGLAPSDYPQGYGGGSLTITKAGVVNLTLKLADGTPLTANTKLSKDLRFPLFVPLYKGLGYLAGETALDSTAPGSDLAATYLGWLRPFDATSLYYPAGWKKSIRVGLKGARYSSSFTPASSALRAADGADLDAIGDGLAAVDAANGNARLAFFDGQLSALLLRKVSIAVDNKVSKVPASDSTFELKITPGPGTMDGTFIHESDLGASSSSKTSFQGVIYQKGPDAAAYGYFLTRKPASMDYAGESGGVVLAGGTTVPTRNLLLGTGPGTVPSALTPVGPQPLQVDIVGPGKVTAGFSPTSSRNVGDRLSITAAPDTTPTPGGLFVNWTIASAHTPEDLAISANDLQKTTLSFVHRQGLILKANFVSNPFVPLGSTKGVEYTGLIHASPALPAPNGTLPGNSTEGFISALVTTTGSFSAKLTIDGSVLPAAGFFDEIGQARFGNNRSKILTVVRLNKPSLLVTLDIDVSPGRTKDTITGTVTATDFQRSVVLAVSTIQADRVFFDALTPATTVPAAYLGDNSADQLYSVVLPPLPLATTHTMALFGINDAIANHGGIIIDESNVLEIGSLITFAAPAPTGLTAGVLYTVVDEDDASPGDNFFSLKTPSGDYADIGDAYDGESVPYILDPVRFQRLDNILGNGDFPEGYGFGTLTVTKGGLVSFSLKLADGSSATGSSRLSKDLRTPLFVQLYNKLGFLGGEVTLDSTDPDSDLSAASLEWVRPLDAAAQHFPGGWKNSVRLGLQGARFSASFTPASSVLLTADDADPDRVGEPLPSADAVSGNAHLVFFNGQLASPLLRRVNIATDNKVSKVPASDSSFELKITAKSGLFEGTFIHENDQGTDSLSKTSYQGIFYQKGLAAGAYGFFQTRKPKGLDYTGESGGVLLLGGTNADPGNPLLELFTSSENGNPPGGSLTTQGQQPLAVQIAGPGSVTAGFSPTSNRQTGDRFSITATPATSPSPGGLFVSWSILSGHTIADLAISASDLQKPILSFVHRQGLILRANFVANPFLPLGNAPKGSPGIEYTGLIHASPTLPLPNGTPRNNSTEGFVSVVLTASGSFTAKLSLEGTTLSAPGFFDDAGQARFGPARATSYAIARTGKPSLVLTLDIDLSPGRTKDSMTGTVTATDFLRSQVLAVSTLRADRAFFDGLTGPTTIPAAYLGAGAATQNYSVILPARPPAEILDVSVFGVNELIPAYGGVIVDFSGRLEVGSEVSFNAPVPGGITAGALYTLADDDDASPNDSYFSLKDSAGSYVDIANAIEDDIFSLNLEPEAHQSASLGLAATDFPGGYGCGTATISKSGAVMFALKLADGTGVSASGKVTKDLKLPFFAQLYKQAGFLSGDITLDSTQTESDFAAVNLDWLRPVDRSSQHYPGGWQPIRVGLDGARYETVFSPASSVLRRADGPDAGSIGDALLPVSPANGNASLAFTGGQLSTELLRRVNVTTDSKVTKVPASDSSFELKLNAAKCAFDGTFIHENDWGIASPEKTAFQGVFYQKGSGAGAYGYFLTRKASALDYTGESGSVILVGDPEAIQ